MDEPSWFTRCAESIREERIEVEKRYGIKIGRTDIRCARCEKLCIPGHRCMGIKEPQPIPRLPKADGIAREWKWCESKHQRICDEVCQNNLHIKKCEKTSKGCRVKSRPMSEEAKARLRVYDIGRKIDEKVENSDPDPLLLKIKHLGPRKAAILLMIPERTVTNWIQRRNVPKRYAGRMDILSRYGER